jgi:uncharacterized protein (TIGR00255 family)
MILSMTGYGKSEAILESGKLVIEFRSVNGKNSDITIKSPFLPKEREMEVRKRIADTLHRGTIDMFITWEPNAADSARGINEELALAYYAQIQSLAEKMSGRSAANPEALLDTILRMPDVIDTRKQDIVNEENWPIVSKAIDEALQHICDYRAKEGEALYKDVTSRVAKILELENEVESYEAERIEAVKEKLLKNIAELGARPDKERFEQELVYYVEKLDINEEKVRLRQHCKYFMDTIDGEQYPGKKLGFIIQEMGREINTTGSKANHASIQKCVVRMKDELEKIREQSMNIL